MQKYELTQELEPPMKQEGIRLVGKSTGEYTYGVRKCGKLRMGQAVAFKTGGHADSDL